MIVTFWGVRGSVPVPGPSTVRYGGNTSCVSVEKDGRLLIIDAGTGIRSLGSYLKGTDTEIFILLTHLHGDHVFGFPLFEPLYERGRRIHALDYTARGDAWSVLDLLDGIHWPVRVDELLSASVRVREDGLEFLAREGFTVRSLAVNHPGGAYGYRIEGNGRAFVHIPDNEIDPPGEVTASFEELVDFCRGADILSHDAQYLPTEVEQTRGWGHSDVGHVCDLAVAAGAGHLVLFHHDPERTDTQLDAVQGLARGTLDPAGIQCTVAREGLRFQL